MLVIYLHIKFCDIHEISRLCVFLTAVQYYLQVFFVQVDETRLTIDAMEITQFSETIANSSCVALAPYLQKLHDQDMKKVALRVTLGPEQVRHMFLPLLSYLIGRWCDLWPLRQLSCDCKHVEIFSRITWIKISLTLRIVIATSHKQLLPDIEVILSNASDQCWDIFEMQFLRVLPELHRHYRGLSMTKFTNFYDVYLSLSKDFSWNWRRFSIDFQIQPNSQVRANSQKIAQQNRNSG